MKALRLLTAGLAGLIFTAAAHAAGGAEHPHPPEGGWPFEGPTGQFDQASLQRGYQVYKEVCSSCHSMKLMSYRNLGEPGGPFYDEAYPNPNDNPYVKALAAENEILSPTPNDIGDFDYRPATPADTFRSPYPNVEAAAQPMRRCTAGICRSSPRPAMAAPAMSTTSWRAIRMTTRSSSAKSTARRQPSSTCRKWAAHGDSHAEGFLKVNPGQYYNPYMAGDTTPSFDGDPRHAPKGGLPGHAAAAAGRPR